MSVTVDELMILIGKQAVELDRLRREVAQIEPLRAEVANKDALVADLQRQLDELTAVEA